MPHTNAVGPEVQRFILSSLPPSRAHKQLALFVLLGILVVVLDFIDRAALADSGRHPFQPFFRFM